MSNSIQRELEEIEHRRKMVDFFNNRRGSSIFAAADSNESGPYGLGRPAYLTQDDDLIVDFPTKNNSSGMQSGNMYSGSMQSGSMYSGSIQSGNMYSGSMQSGNMSSSYNQNDYQQNRQNTDMEGVMMTGSMNYSSTSDYTSSGYNGGQQQPRLGEAARMQQLMNSEDLPGGKNHRPLVGGFAAAAYEAARAHHYSAQSETQGNSNASGDRRPPPPSI